MANSAIMEQVYFYNGYSYNKIYSMVD